MNDLGDVGDAGVSGEVVDRALDGAALGEFGDMPAEEWAFDEGGVVEVLFGSCGERQVGEVAVVVVELEVDAAEGVCEFVGEGGFAGAGAACNGKDDGVVRTAGFWKRVQGVESAHG